ncbi:MAG: 3'(2'),5'-bisphosphate nucleotidase [Chlamydiae bacterium]|nr:3'(2'),5'-bisphosphate nucleotidase [Chlamydiota bacterium]MBI3266577.1 3'(2'),5'-bisphosphate nucleotidase [Chlamydiota bacterium]
MKFPFPLTPEIKFALEAVRKASQLTVAVQNEMKQFSSLQKSDQSPVTVADLAAQAIVAHLLEEKLPQDILVGEESSEMLGLVENRNTLDQVLEHVKRFFSHATLDGVCDWIDRGTAEPAYRFWTLDPVDGTKGFLRGDQYAVALAFIVNGKVEIGVLGCPNLKEAKFQDVGGVGSLVIAIRGKGCWSSILKTEHLSFLPLHVSDCREPRDAVLMRSYDRSHTNEAQLEKIKDALHLQKPPIRLDSLSKYTVLASGKADLFFRLLPMDRPDYRDYIWDQAAGDLILQEAGGKVTDLDGKALDYTAGKKLFNNRGALASNGFLHEAALKAVKEEGI